MNLRRKSQKTSAPGQQNKGVSSDMTGEINRHLVRNPPGLRSESSIGSASRASSVGHEPLAINIAWSNPREALETAATVLDQSESISTQMDVLDLEPHDVLGSTSSPPPASADKARGREFRHPLQSTDVTTSTALAVREFEPGRISQMLIGGPVSADEDWRRRNLSPELIDTSRYLDVHAPKSTTIVGATQAETPTNEKEKATLMIARLRQQGLLPQAGADAKLVVLQPAPLDENTMLERMAGSQRSDIGPSSSRAAEPESSSQGSSSPDMYAGLDGKFGARVRSVESLHSSTSSVGVTPGSVHPPSFDGKSRPPRLAHAWAPEGSASVYKKALEELKEAGPREATASQWRPLEPESPHLDGREPTTPLCDDAPPPPPPGRNPRPLLNPPKVEF